MADRIPKRHCLVVATFILAMMLYVDRVCISAAKDSVQSDLELSDKQMGWVLSIFSLGYALCQTPGGMLADRFGPRRVLTCVVAFFSLLTGLSAAAYNYGSMLVCRLLFGVGEAGAFPGIARAVFSWIPMRERGMVQAINFSGSRIGAAFALPGVAYLVSEWGWRTTFVVLAVVGFGWAFIWYLWFRDDPTLHASITTHERELILRERQPGADATDKLVRLPLARLARSRDMQLMAAQYFASNFTFFFCLSWLFPHLKDEYNLATVETGFYASAPFLAGALGNWVAGAMVDAIYRKGHWALSRRLPAIVGFALAAGGMIASAYMTSVFGSIACLSVAVFGADMTLSPSWSLCVDMGRRHAGTVSGTMNMAGNLGSFVTALAFPYLQAWTGSTTPFFFIAAGLNIVAIVAWLAARPDRPLEGS